MWISFHSDWNNRKILYRCANRNEKSTYSTSGKIPSHFDMFWLFQPTPAGILISSILVSLILKWRYKLQNIKKENEKLPNLLCSSSSSPTSYFFFSCFVCQLLPFLYFFYFFSFSSWFKCRCPFTCLAIWLLNFQVSTIHSISFGTFGVSFSFIISGIIN